MKEAKDFMGLGTFLLYLGILAIRDIPEATVEHIIGSPIIGLLGLACFGAGLRELIRVKEPSGFAKYGDGFSSPIVTLGVMVLIFSVAAKAIRMGEISPLWESGEEIVVGVGLVALGLVLGKLARSARR